MNTLYICEKPSQARDIAKVLGVNSKKEGYIEGNGITVTWCLGHLLELAPPDDYCENIKPWRMEVLPIVPKEWRMKPNPKTKAQLKVIKSLLKEAKNVVVATDADREGDVIGRELLDYFNFNGGVQRLWLSALDEASIKKALGNIKPGESTYPLYQAGLGRQRADWSIGMNMTMATTHLFGTRGQGVLSVGRVQTPTLGLVVKRDLEIENFKPKDYFELQVLFRSQKGDFWANWQIPEDYTDMEGRCLKPEYAQAVAAKVKAASGEVVNFEEKLKKVSPPVCFSLSSLQKLCSSKLGMTAKETLKVAQSLYEQHKATTYPRTDSGYLPESQFEESKQVLNALVCVDPEIKTLVEQADAHHKSPTWNDKKVTAHHGIIPTTNTNVSFESMSSSERKVYDLIRRYYIAQFMGNYEYVARKAEVDCAKENFKAQCNIPSNLGWKKAISAGIEETEDEGEQEQESSIPKLDKGEELSVNDSKILAKQTKPPARFTEGTLIAAMKNIAKFVDDPKFKKILRDSAGIGTEATRADIIEKLINRNFIDRKKTQLISTERGRALIEILPEQIKNPGTTALWEQALDDIAKGEGELESFLYDQEDILDFMLSDLVALRRSKGGGISSDNTHPCPKCKSPLAKRKGGSGYFWGCTRYPECNGIMGDVNGKPVAKVQTSEILCPDCKKGKLVHRKGKKGFWWGCNAFPSCKATFTDKSVGVLQGQETIVSVGFVSDGNDKI